MSRSNPVGAWARGRAPGRLVRLCAVALLAAFSLTGCMKVEGDVTIHSDDTVSGSFVFAVDKALPQALGQTEEEFLDEMRSDMDGESDDGVFGGGLDDTKVTDYRSGRYIGVKQEFSDVKLSEFDEDDFRIVREGDKYVFTARFDTNDSGLSESDPSDPSDSGDLGGLENLDEEALGELYSAGPPRFTFKITFPGEVISANGDVDGRSVTWDIPLTETTGAQDLKAEGKATADKAWLWWLIGGVLVLLAIVGVVAFLLARRARRRREMAQAAAYGGPGFPGVYPEQAGYGPDGQPYDPTRPGYYADQSAWSAHDAPTSAQPQPSGYQGGYGEPFPGQYSGPPGHSSGAGYPGTRAPSHVDPLQPPAPGQQNPGQAPPPPGGPSPYQ